MTNESANAAPPETDEKQNSPGIGARLIGMTNSDARGT